MPSSPVLRLVQVSAVGVLAIVGPVMAQEIPGLASGARVRVWTREPHSKRRVGTLVALRRDTLLMQLEGDTDTMRIARAAVTRIDASEGRRSHVVTGLILGAAAGGTTGYFIGKGLDNTSVCGSGCEWLVAGPLAGVGGVLGGLVGAVTRTDRWKEVTHERVRVGVAPRDAGMGLVASIAL